MNAIHPDKRLVRESLIRDTATKRQNDTGSDFTPSVQNENSPASFNFRSQGMSKSADEDDASPVRSPSSFASDASSAMASGKRRGRGRQSSRGTRKLHKITKARIEGGNHAKSTPSKHAESKVNSVVTLSQTPHENLSKSKPSELDIFQLLMEKYRGKATVEELRENTNAFPSKVDVDQWSTEVKRNLTTYIDEDGHLTVSVFQESGRVCFSYNSRRGCDRVSCRFLHICKNYVAGFCRFGQKCKFTHGFNELVTQDNLRKLNLDCFSDEQKLTILQLSAPFVCSDYQEGGCRKAERCEKLHLCRDYIMTKNSCCEARDGEKCKLCHDLDSGHTKSILKRYGLSDVEERQTLMSILVPVDGHIKLRKTKSHFPVTENSKFKRRTLRSSFNVTSKDTETGKRPRDESYKTLIANKTVHNQEHGPSIHIVEDIEAPICVDNLVGRCKEGICCSHNHFTGPYQWVFEDHRLPHRILHEYHHTSRYMFTEDVNTIIEKAFCDVYKTGVDISTRCAGSMRQRKKSTEDLTINFEDMSAKQTHYGKQTVGQVYRPSTPSYNKVNPYDNTACSLATWWKWYFKDNGNIWTPYALSDSGLVLDDMIESAYLAKTSGCLFQTGGFHYTLTFNPLMQQTNLETHTERQVRRRPVYVSTADWKELVMSVKTHANLSAPSSALPSSWKPISEDVDFVRFAVPPQSGKYESVEKLFRKTMDSSGITIISIDQIQNPHMWKKYQSQKEYMTKKVHVADLEMHLFHGTDKDAVVKICKHNFDFRVSGKNGTLFGEGSYFARDASYSDRYSRSDSAGWQYMFLAHVLVGKYALGKGSYKRPPEVTPESGDLYDSCVNRLNDPTIFVIFDRDQLYPRYLITYTKKSCTNGLASHGQGSNLPVHNHKSSSVQSNAVSKSSFSMSNTVPSIKVSSSSFGTPYGPQSTTTTLHTSNTSQSLSSTVTNSKTDAAHHTVDSATALAFPSSVPRNAPTTPATLTSSSGISHNLQSPSSYSTSYTAKSKRQSTASDTKSNSTSQNVQTTAATISANTRPQNVQSSVVASSNLKRHIAKSTKSNISPSIASYNSQFTSVTSSANSTVYSMQSPIVTSFPKTTPHNVRSTVAASAEITSPQNSTQQHVQSTLVTSSPISTLCDVKSTVVTSFPASTSHDVQSTVVTSSPKSTPHAVQSFMVTPSTNNAYAVQSTDVTSSPNSTPYIVQSTVVTSSTNSTPHAVPSNEITSSPNSTPHAVQSTDVTSSPNSTPYVVQSTVVTSSTNNTSHAVPSTEITSSPNSTPHDVQSTVVTSSTNSTPHAVQSTAVTSSPNSTPYVVQSTVVTSSTNSTPHDVQSTVVTSSSGIQFPPHSAVAITPSDRTKHSVQSTEATLSTTAPLLSSVIPKKVKSTARMPRLYNNQTHLASSFSFSPPLSAHGAVDPITAFSPGINSPDFFQWNEGTRSASARSRTPQQSQGKSQEKKCTVM
ncbi:uncharacterized protein [Ptychodera flava]|uniref:uncharacterized protein n=1 Tax=Ptychodera flava TaxID=63121 RepID=UPI00396AA1C9